MPKLVTLEVWAHAIYGDDAPGIATLRRWARDAKIVPLAEKHGRTYFVHPDARYSSQGLSFTRRRLVDRLGIASKPKQRG